MFKYLIFCGFLIIRLNLFGQSNDKPLFSFGVIADVQYADRENLGSRHYRASLQKLPEAVQVFNTEKVNFVVSLGDFINDDFKSYNTLTTITDKLKPPLYHVLGNHEFEVLPNKKNQVLPVLDLKQDYYSFRKKNWKFIFLNGNDISLLANAEGSIKYKEAQQILTKLQTAGVPNAKPWNGTLGRDQINWLHEELAQAKRKNQQVIIFCHFPLYPNNSSYTLWNVNEIRNIIAAYPNVKAYLNGHVHTSQYFFEKGVHHVTFRGMVEKDENAFGIISVFKNHLEIKGYGQEISRTLK